METVVLKKDITLTVEAFQLEITREGLSTDQDC